MLRHARLLSPAPCSFHTCIYEFSTCNLYSSNTTRHLPGRNRDFLEAGHVVVGLGFGSHASVGRSACILYPRLVVTQSTPDASKERFACLSDGRQRAGITTHPAKPNQLTCQLSVLFMSEKCFRSCCRRVRMLSRRCLRCLLFRSSSVCWQLA